MLNLHYTHEFLSILCNLILENNKIHLPFIWIAHSEDYMQVNVDKSCNNAQKKRKGYVCTVCFTQ